MALNYVCNIQLEIIIFWICVDSKLVLYALKNGLQNEKGYILCWVPLKTVAIPEELSIRRIEPGKV